MQNKLRFTLLALASLVALRAAEPVLIDFGSAASRTDATSGKTWNNVDDKNQRGLSDFPLLDVKGEPSGILLTVVSPFAGVNASGVKEAAAGYPASAVRDSLFANVKLFGKQENVTPVLRLSGLRPQTRYTLTFFASRLGGDDRTTRYTMTGADSSHVELDAANNQGTVATTTPLSPKEDGTLTIVISPGPTNNNAHNFTYLGVLQIQSQD